MLKVHWLFYQRVGIAHVVIRLLTHNLHRRMLGYKKSLKKSHDNQTIHHNESILVQDAAIQSHNH